MTVISGPIGRERVHYQAPDAERLNAEMRAFLGWFNGPQANDSVLVAIANAVFHATGKRVRTLSITIEDVLTT